MFLLNGINRHHQNHTSMTVIYGNPINCKGCMGSCSKKLWLLISVKIYDQDKD